MGTERTHDPNALASRISAEAAVIGLEVGEVAMVWRF